MIETKISQYSLGRRRLVSARFCYRGTRYPQEADEGPIVVYHPEPGQYFRESVGNKCFVPSNAAHEIRVNKDLNAMEIKDKHGDFAGRRSKLDKHVADGLSNPKRRQDNILVARSLAEHKESRPHHDPVEADDYLHQAIDRLDAVRDPLRTASSGFGYQERSMSFTEVRTEFIDKAREAARKLEAEGKTDEAVSKSLEAEAVDAVLRWKEKGSSPIDIRKDFHKLYEKSRSGRS